MSQINYHNVEIRQQENIVLEEVNLQIHKGEFVYLIGKVGSGKSSLLKTMYGELDIHSGQAEVLAPRDSGHHRGHGGRHGEAAGVLQVGVRE